MFHATEPGKVRKSVSSRVTATLQSSAVKLSIKPWIQPEINVWTSSYFIQQHGKSKRAHYTDHSHYPRMRKTTWILLLPSWWPQPVVTSTSDSPLNKTRADLSKTCWTWWEDLSLIARLGPLPMWATGLFSIATHQTQWWLWHIFIIMQPFLIMGELTFLVWNCGGLIAPHKRASTLSLLKSRKVDIALLQETHLLCANSGHLANKFYHTIPFSSATS